MRGIYQTQYPAGNNYFHSIWGWRSQLRRGGLSASFHGNRNRPLRRQHQNGSLGWLRDLWERGWLKGLLLLTAVIFVYQPVWHGKTIWDDDAHLTPPGLRSPQGLARIWIEPGATQQYYPLVHSIFWVEYKLWGDTTLGYHLINILLHAFSAAVVENPAAVAGAGSLSGGGHFRLASRLRGVGGLDLGNQEHVVGGILSGRGAGLFEI